ncbi:MAG TPA: T9SS type A sorting domain-containing protein [Chitinophagaceae bacterium]|nr:T9SS type A sorting domain-containing protein [Chitinophagaceae bacterium]
MKTALLLYLVLCSFTLPSVAQLCPGGGTSFASAVTFDPAWIYGCNTGTSCNGGVSLDNRVACLPVITLDACAPLPSCGIPLNTASNVWFKFFPTGTTATISCFQNTSLVIGIQAFSGSTCGALTDMGCALSAGPSSGVQLPLSGLHPGTLYYFRIFGSAGPVSQRTGLYCFCGTTGLNNIVLPKVISGFSGQAAGNGIELNWDVAAAAGGDLFEAERSTDGISFVQAGKGIQYAPLHYRFNDAAPAGGTNFYRIRHLLPGGRYDYSGIISVQPGPVKSFVLVPGSGELKITSADACQATLYDAWGRPVQSFRLETGSNLISTRSLASGVYFIRAAGHSAAQKFFLSH